MVKRKKKDPVILSIRLPWPDVVVQTCNPSIPELEEEDNLG